jgi:tetratricopeptide (TPR) repeat protein
MRGVLAAGALALVLATAGRARAGDTEDARAYTDKATAAFALAHYAAAADYFEKAFEFRSDPALLYNAAQSHRLAGNKERALVLYRNYLRLYAKKEKRAEIEARVDELEKAIAHDKAVETKPPNTTEATGAAPPVAPLPAEIAAPPPGAAANPPPPAAVPPPAVVPPSGPTSTVPTLVGEPTPRAQDDSLVKKPWFWIATGAGVAVAVTVVLLLTMGGAKDPSPNIGRVNAN